jgi:hypothetical protein
LEKSKYLILLLNYSFNSYLLLVVFKVLICNIWKDMLLIHGYFMWWLAGELVCLLIMDLLVVLVLVGWPTNNSCTLSRPLQLGKYCSSVVVYIWIRTDLVLCFLGSAYDAKAKLLPLIRKNTIEWPLILCDELSIALLCQFREKSLWKHLFVFRKLIWIYVLFIILHVLLLLLAPGYWWWSSAQMMVILSLHIMLHAFYWSPLYATKKKWFYHVLLDQPSAVE